ncbi:MAG: hypothetical protein WC979_05235 [Candidatus Pacearchaeota archaeon]|jgi:hypothetical protein
MALKNWKEVIDEEPRPRVLRVTKKTLINTLRFSAFRGAITPDYANRRIRELEEAQAQEEIQKQEAGYGFFRSSYNSVKNYVTGFFIMV